MLKSNRNWFAGELKMRLAADTRQFQFVDFSFNSLKMLYNLFPVHMSESITHLRLNFSSIRVICYGTFSSLVNLEELELNNNEIGAFDWHWFRTGDVIGASELRVLSLAANRLKCVSAVDFNRLPSLELLNLSGNCIRCFNRNRSDTLETLWLQDNLLEVFECNRFPELTFLDVSDNILRTLTPKTFDGLSQLYFISVRANQLTAIESGTFDSMVNLNYLTLEKNQLTTLADRLLGNCSQLTNICVCSNPVIQMPRNLFATDSDMRHYCVDRTEMTAVPECLTHGCENLKLLQLNHNRFATITKSDFGQLIDLRNVELNENRAELRLKNGIFENNLQLKTIAFYRSNIYEIEDGTFTRLDLLKVLDLRKNRLTRLPAKFVSPNAILKRLLLDDNRLEMVAAVSFKSLAILNLSLAGNPIMKLPHDFFAGFAKTKTLNLSFIDFRMQPVPDLSALVHLEQLHLAGCGICHLQRQQFWPLQRLTLLNLRQNNFREFKLDLRKTTGTLPIARTVSNSLESPLFDLENTLQNLFLSDCQIEHIGTEVFQNLGQLKSLDLSSNRLRFVDTNMFDALEAIVFINLDNNRIENLFRNPFKNNPCLRMLSVGGCNRLRQIDAGLVNKWQRLRELRVNTGCEIRTEQLTNEKLRIKWQ